MEKSQMPSAVEIVKRLTGASDIKETHISYALMARDHVYKIKKAVDFVFLDYRQLKSRRAFCILEKELNDRFSDGVYLEVMKLVRRSGDTFALVPVESSLTAMEYVLKMKRIAEDDFLNSRLSAGKIGYADMVRIGAEVAALLKNLEKASSEDFADAFSSVKFNAEENFNQTEKYAGSFIDIDSYEFIKRKSLKFLDDNKDLFNKRAETGFVKNGHGDLRLEHIFFNQDGSVGLIDCIEFNRRFRQADVMAEAAFLSMELDVSGQSEMADGFIEGFLSVFSDEESVRLLNYYRSYLAYVRAKVACFLLDDKGETWDGYSAKKAEIARLIDMSAYYALCADEIETPLFYGIMGTGKSKNAKAFAERFPVCRINSDEVRKNDAGVPVNEKIYLDYGKGVYSKENSVKIYAKMASFVASKIKIGRSCLVDASFIAPEYLDEFKNTKTGRLRFFQFSAPDDVIMERLKSRLDNDDVVSDGRPAIYAEQKETAKMPPAELVIETTGSVSDNVERIFKTLIK